MRVEEISPAEPLPRPPKFAGVGFGLMASDEQPATASTASRAAGRSRTDNRVCRIAMRSLLLADAEVAQSLASGARVSNRDSCWMGRCEVKICHKQKRRGCCPAVSMVQ